MNTFNAFVSGMIDFLSLEPFAWLCALAIFYFGFVFFWSLFNKR